MLNAKPFRVELWSILKMLVQTLGHTISIEQNINEQKKKNQSKNHWKFDANN